MELDGVGRGPGGKRVANLIDKLSAGGAASEGKYRHIQMYGSGDACGGTSPSKEQSHRHDDQGCTDGAA